MKKILLIIPAILCVFCMKAQDIAGQWTGILKVQGTQLRLVFNIVKSGNGYISTMDSPDQGAMGISVSTTVFENSVLKLAVLSAKIEYEGVLDKNNFIIGNFKQSGQSFPMNLSKEKITTQKPIRPQEPVKPYPYYSEDVMFDNAGAGIKLAGTLTLPKKEGYFPAVILISGSGPQNRDEELLGHKPFLVLSDYLTKNGIAVFRYDDRGTALSQGVFKTATTADFSTDAAAAVKYLKSRREINKNKIGLIGHSEGGIIAPLVAADSKDIYFIVLMAGTGIPGDKLMLLQQELIARAAGASEIQIQQSLNINRDAFKIITKSDNPDKLNRDLSAYLRQILKDHPEKPEGITDSAFIQKQINQITGTWMQYFLKYDPAAALAKVKCPVLALNGEKDLQVPPKINLNAIKNALEKGGNKKVTVKELPGLNHLFQECKTGSPSEYAVIEQTISPIALTEILNWIKLQLK